MNGLGRSKQWMNKELIPADKSPNKNQNLKELRSKNSKLNNRGLRFKPNHNHQDLHKLPKTRERFLKSKKLC